MVDCGLAVKFEYLCQRTEIAEDEVVHIIDKPISRITKLTSYELFQ